MNQQQLEREVREVVGAWAEQMALAAQAQAAAYFTLARDIKPAFPWSPVADLQLAERPARQALFLAALKLRTDDSADGHAPMQDCLRLAKHFGYDTRGTAGFYRRSADGSPGLLVRTGEQVQIGSAGLDRIAQYGDFVAENSARIESSRTV